MTKLEAKEEEEFNSCVTALLCPPPSLSLSLSLAALLPGVSFIAAAMVTIDISEQIFNPPSFLCLPPPCCNQSEDVINPTAFLLSLSLSLCVLCAHLRSDCISFFSFFLRFLPFRPPPPPKKATAFSFLALWGDGGRWMHLWRSFA